MASVELGPPDDVPQHLPALCVKTGVPTGESVRLSGAAAPGWTGAMILFGLFAWFFASSMASRRYVLVLPWRLELVRQYRSWRRGGWVLVAAGPVLAVAASAWGISAGALLLCVSVIGVVVIVSNEWRSSVGVRLSPEAHLVLTRVHPDFAHACRERLGLRTG